MVHSCDVGAVTGEDLVVFPEAGGAGRSAPLNCGHNGAALGSRHVGDAARKGTI